MLFIGGMVVGDLPSLLSGSVCYPLDVFPACTVIFCGVLFSGGVHGRVGGGSTPVGLIVKISRAHARCLTSMCVLSHFLMSCFQVLSIGGVVVGAHLSASLSELVGHTPGVSPVCVCCHILWCLVFRCCSWEGWWWEHACQPRCQDR